MDYYILDDHHQLVPVEDPLVWARWFEAAGHDRSRFVQQDADEQTGWWVSTVFLGLNHNWFGQGPPLVFESMVFAGRGAGQPGPAFTKKWDGYQDRYSTWEEALAGHRAILAAISRDLTIERTELL